MARVLVIEDNPLNMKLASLLLSNAGHTVLCAVDAETGLALAQAAPPDLILMDFQLPGMSGLEATTLLKQDAATATIPVIALTAMEADQERGRVAGCDAYIVKPLRYQELYAAIGRLLPNAMPRPPSPAAATAQTRAVLPVDVGVLESLIGNEPAVVLDFLHAFQTGAASIALELRTACVNHQAAQAGKQAHKLKSSAHIAGALALGKLCAEMETAGKAGNTETLMTLLPLFEHELAAVNTFLDSLQAQRVVRLFISPESRPDPTTSPCSPRQSRS